MWPSLGQLLELINSGPTLRKCRLPTIRFHAALQPTSSRTTKSQSSTTQHQTEDNFDWEENAPNDETTEERRVSNVHNSQTMATNTSDQVNGPTVFDFYDMRSPAPIEDEETEQQNLTPAAELLCAHYKLSHLPFSQIRLMAANGHLPKRLIGCRVP